MTLNDARIKAIEMGYTQAIITPESDNGPQVSKIEAKMLEKFCLTSFANDEVCLQLESTNLLIGKNVRVFTIKDGWISKKPIMAFFGIQTK